MDKFSSTHQFIIRTLKKISLKYILKKFANKNIF